MTKFLKRLLEAMAKATTDQERTALYNLIEQIRDDQDVDDNFWADLEDRLDVKMDALPNIKVRRTSTPRLGHRYTASHKRATKPTDDCHQTIMDAEERDEIERFCPKCAKNAKFKYEPAAK